MWNRNKEPSKREMKSYPNKEMKKKYIYFWMNWLMKQDMKEEECKEINLNNS